jgi:hypothetical protein
MIPKNYKKLKIKNLNLNYKFTQHSNPININLNSDGEDINIDSINYIRRLSKIENIKTYSEYFSNFSNILNIYDEKVRWDILLDKNRNNEYLNYIKKEIDYSIDMLTTYHTSVLKKRISAYLGLTQIKLNQKPMVIPVYRHESITGRTSIKLGTNYLTMKKIDKTNLRSLKKDHILVEIDFKSCEPNFYLRAINKKINNSDVYLDISEKLNLDIKDRTRFKRGILSILYGASDNTAKNMIKCTNKDLNAIKEYFMIEEFKKCLVSQFDNNNAIHNYYGRPVCFNHSLINYWIQSSAADYCSLAFKSLIDDYDLTPCFYVHDSMTFEINKDRLSEIQSIKSITEPISNINIPVDITIIG